MKKSDFALNVNPYLWEIGYFRYKRIFGARPIKPHFEPILYFKKLPLTRNLAKSKPAQKNRFRTGPKSEEVPPPPAWACMVVKCFGLGEEVLICGTPPLHDPYSDFHIKWPKNA